jgi:NADPH:quinone reductase-like Zn-dependent oxidoreductase
MIPWRAVVYFYFFFLFFINSSYSKKMSSPNSFMKAMVYGRQRVEQLQRPIPTLQRESVLVQVMASGLNPVDAKYVLGDKITHSRLKEFVKQKFVDQKVIGFDFSGVVVASSDSSLYKTGDAVYGTMPPLQGTLCEYICAPLHQVSHKPTSLSFVQAAALPLVGLTAVQSLTPHLPIRRILVIGASGGTGHVALSVSKALGVQDIVAVCSGRNRDFCVERGATHVVDYTVGDVAEQIREYCQQHGLFDVIFDSVTSADPRDAQHNYPSKLMEYCTHRYIRLGGGSWDWFRAGWERTGLQCFGKEKLFWITFPNSSGQLQQLAEWGESVAPHISRVLDFTPEQVQEGFDLILDRRVQGKIVVRVGNEKEND